MSLTIVDRLTHDHEHRAIVEAMTAVHAPGLDVASTIEELDGRAGTDAVIALCRWARQHNIDLFPGMAPR
jgi:hypothetical protein